uniref:Uncharacterized protein n=1 Tax=Anopheles albimanus TaxID=7167 RepID=A0A182FWZ3_ANOAL
MTQFHAMLHKWKKQKEQNERTNERHLKGHAR